MPCHSKFELTRTHNTFFSLPEVNTEVVALVISLFQSGKRLLLKTDFVVIARENVAAVHKYGCCSKAKAFSCTHMLMLQPW